jgi:hypothetical protein
MKKLLSLFLMLTVWISVLRAQVSNDECSNPTIISDVTAFCSATGAFTNVGATASTYGPAGCFGTTTQKDVWFTFTPLATDVTITVRGATAGGGTGGTLRNPQVALYYGACGSTINELGCDASTGNTNVAELYEGGLFVGTPYLIRVQGGGGQTGTFQICINNYNPPVDPSSDCPKASILCDKSSFVVKSVVGAGADNKEMEDASCFDNGSPGLKESNSTWFVWTCSKSGPLEFALTPLNAPDDLDFVLYRLPNGIRNCSGKQVVRCMASGLSSNQNFPSPCLGATGLRTGDNDTSEDAGCSDNGDDAWLSPFNMVQGESYALVVNNFSDTGNGFSVSFAGTGEFRGPEAKFTTEPAAVCLGTAVNITDASTFTLGNITAWRWSFGANATPQTATGKGPHTVQFNQSGNIPVVLTLETNLGCKVTDIQTVTVYPKVEVDTVIAAPDCNGTANGSVEITNIKMGTPPYQYSWNGGPFQASNKLSNLGVGLASLVIRDKNNCETALAIPIKERILTVNPKVQSPLCTGNSNGVITFEAINGVAPLQFDWGNGFVPGNSQSGFKAGVYTIKGIDAVLCKGTFTVTVTDNPQLDLKVDTAGVTCFGANDGTAKAIPGGGVTPYSYLWSNSQTTADIKGLMKGTYSVTVNDANRCSATQTFSLTEPADVGIRVLNVKDLVCNGLPTGVITVEGIGGRSPYSFSTDGKKYQPGSALQNLPAGDYWIKIKDGGGCIDSVMATIGQPEPVAVTADPKDTLVTLGNTIIIRTTTSPPARTMKFEWNPTTGLDDPKKSTISLQATRDDIYVVKITDPDGCMATDTVRIRVSDDRPVYIPNVIMPETASNPQNGRFTVYSNAAVKPDNGIELLRIFDRWGDLVYEGKNMPINDPSVGWDGTYNNKVLSGVFTYYTLIRFIDDKVLTYKGNVTVVR